MKVAFDVKYGRNYIDIPDAPAVAFENSSLCNLYADKVTVFNDIAAGNIEARHFDRHVIDKCSIQGGYVRTLNGNVENLVGTTMVITRSVDKYLPIAEYRALPADRREDFYTAQPGDVVVLREVDDVVETASEWNALKQKYKDEMFIIKSANHNGKGMAVENVTMMSA